MTTARRNPTRWRLIGYISFMYGGYILIEGILLPGVLFMLGGAALFPVVNRYILYVPRPVGVAISALGWLMYAAQVQA